MPRSNTRGANGALKKTEITKAKALKAFSLAGTVQDACGVAEIGRRTWYNWMEDDPVFAAQVMEATEGVSDELEKEAIARAKAGSDTLLIFLLKSRRRHLYGDKVHVSIQDDPRIQQFIQSLMGIVQTNVGTAVYDTIQGQLSAALEKTRAA